MPSHDIAIIDHQMPPLFTYDRLSLWYRETNLQNAVNQILAVLGKDGKIECLRFFGHGRPGRQLVGCGENEPGPDQQIAWRNGKMFGKTQLRRLEGRFAPGAVLELRGCNVADGKNGEALLLNIAGLLKVVVCAGNGRQADTGDVFEWENSMVQATPGSSKVVKATVEKKWPPR